MSKKKIKPTMAYRSKIVVNVINHFIKKKDRVLDVGCGNGWITEEVRKKTGCQTTGTDILNYLEINMPFKKMKSSGKLPFKSNSFDIVTFVDMLHHVGKEDQERLIREGLRVGKRVIIFEVKPTVLAKLIDYLINQIHNTEMNIPLNFRSVDGWKWIFKRIKCKHKVIDVKKPNILYPIKNYIFVVEKK